MLSLERIGLAKQVDHLGLPPLVVEQLNGNKRILSEYSKEQYLLSSSLITASRFTYCDFAINNLYMRPFGYMYLEFFSSTSRIHLSRCYDSEYRGDIIISPVEFLSNLPYYLQAAEVISKYNQSIEWSG